MQTALPNFTAFDIYVLKLPNFTAFAHKYILYHILLLLHKNLFFTKIYCFSFHTYIDFTKIYCIWVLYTTIHAYVFVTKFYCFCTQIYSLPKFTALELNHYQILLLLIPYIFYQNLLHLSSIYYNTCICDHYQMLLL